MNDPLPNGVKDDFRGAVQIQFLHQVHAVGFDGGNPDFEQVGNLFIGAAFGQKMEHFLFTIRQKVVRVSNAALTEKPYVIFE